MKIFSRQPCKIGGRQLHVPNELLASEASCSHCSARSIANGIESAEQHGFGKQPITSPSSAHTCYFRLGVNLERCEITEVDAAEAYERKFA